MLAECVYKGKKIFGIFADTLLISGLGSPSLKNSFTEGSCMKVWVNGDRNSLADIKGDHSPM